MCGDVKAGFPSPADDMREKLDLVRLLVRHPASTFFFRASGTSLVDASLDEGDIIIVDKSLEPHYGCIAVCHIDGEFTVKRVAIDAHGVKLMPANERYEPIRITEQNNFIVWGVVTFVIKRV
jgi:DNA polymerase V